MMTLRQYALVKFAEECTEAAQRALKQAQFGADEVQPGQEQNNAERLQGEIWDIEFWERRLSLMHELPVTSAYHENRDAHMRAKRAKVDTYLQLAQDRGEVHSGKIL